MAVAMGTHERLGTAERTVVIKGLWTSEHGVLINAMTIYVSPPSETPSALDRPPRSWMSVFTSNNTVERAVR